VVELTLYFDGDCPLCAREVAMLRRLDRRGRIAFVDIAAVGFDPGPLGRTLDELMGSIHAQTSEGEWLTGVEVFRRLYSLVGFGPLVALSRLPGVAQGLEWGYRVFARNRLRWTGRDECTDRCQVPARVQPAEATAARRSA
jgi:predicted DCC family thiol-disulfide oxidoreductase YuxK